MSLLKVAPEEMTGLKIEAEKTSLIEKLQSQIDGLLKINSDTTNQNIGRDMTTTTTNDTALMEFIIDKFWLIFVAMIGFMKWELIRQDKNYKRQIKQLQVEKADYKDKFLTNCIHSEDDYKKFRAEHEKIKT